MQERGIMEMLVLMLLNKLLYINNFEEAKYGNPPWTLETVILRDYITDDNK
jgi:hypothetical protein